MEKIIRTKYIKQSVTKQWLQSNEFRYNRLLSDEDKEVYTYRFPVLKCGKFTTLECELRVILGEENVIINVYEYGTNDKYAPFYYCEYGKYYTILKEIHKRINKKLDLLEIEKEGD